MKFNKLFLGFLAAGVLAACTNDNQGPDGVGNNELVTSYVALNVKAAVDVNRAVTDGGFAEGSNDEQAVNKAHFFFFNQAGGAFAINAESKEAGDGENYIVRNVSDIGNNLDNVETITNTVVAIKNNKGEIPASVVAVLNWDYNGGAIALETLKTQLIDLAAATDKTNGFIMSNSVYVAGSEVVEATPIEAINIASSQEDAENAPIDIYVERLAAKVMVVQNNTSFDTGVAVPGGTGNIQAKIKGWSLNTTIDKSNLIKNVSADWITAAPFANWNDILNFRSYWAASASTGTLLDKDFSYNELVNAVGEPVHCLENTDNATGNNTKALVAVEFFDGNDNAVQVAKFYGGYMTFNDLKNYVANSFASTYYCDNGADKVSIAADDIEFAAVESADIHDSYKVTYKLTTAAKAKNWYLSDGTSVTTDDVEAALATVEKAQAWNGKGYYIVNIEHFGNKLGVVRNHSYEINVTGIEGLGTAVYDGDKIVDEPVSPVDDNSYIAARINVLSWKIVKNDVVLQ